jgi:ribosomal protein S18 acetylase RimI-like enzyme
MKASPVKIRQFQASDLPAMQRVRHAAFKPVFQSFRDIVGEEIYRLALVNSDRAQERLLATLCQPSGVDRMFVATVAGEIVGFVSFSLNSETRIGEIGLNAVHPGHASRGIGVLMYEFVIARMKEMGMAIATVGTGGDSSHAPARRAYGKAGFNVGIPSIFLYRIL